MKISVIIPAYNEVRTVGRCIREVYERNPGLNLEVLVVDDGSTDGTGAAAEAEARPGLKVLRRPDNRGKGAAIRTALAEATGDVVMIQDADLEYDPGDYPRLLAPFAEPSVQVVYGSRILQPDNPLSYHRYYWGGRCLSWWTNLLYGSAITDEPTCYKLFRTELLRSLGLTCTGFEFCPEATAKALKRGIRIFEVPISYRPRSIAEGKKIRWRDGLIAVWTLLRLRWTQ